MQEQTPNPNRHPTPAVRGRSVTRMLVGLLALLFCFQVATIPGPDARAVSARPEGAEEVAKKQETPDTVKKKSDPSITVYVTSWCPACSMAINYLKKKKVPFTVKDVEKNPDYMKEMVGKVGGYRGVPVLDINGKTYLGFHPSIIDQITN